jgi:hypothetical protein
MELIEKWGFVPFFRNEIRGFSIEELIERSLWFTGNDGPWEWKGPVIRECGCAYGKFFCSKAVFISREWYPEFANWRRDGYDYDARFEDGLASLGDKHVYDLLEAHGPLLSTELKQLGGFGKDGRKGFDTVLTRLQMQGYVTTADFEYRRDKHGAPYGWGIARYAVPELHFGADFTARVYAHTPEESRQRILAHLAALFPQATETQLQKLLG